MFEENRMDILITSAGVVTKYDFWNMDEKEIRFDYGYQCQGNFLHELSSGQQMVEKHIQGYILNVTSSLVLRPAQMGREGFDTGACRYDDSTWNRCQCHCSGFDSHADAGKKGR